MSCISLLLRYTGLALGSRARADLLGFAKQYRNWQRVLVEPCPASANTSTGVHIFSSDICACLASHCTYEDTCLIWAPHTESGQLSPSLAVGLVPVTSLTTNCLFSLLYVVSCLSSCMGNYLFSSPPTSWVPLITSFLSLPGPYALGTAQFP